ncbi:MAG: metal ABC transporter ATP-binding protein [Succinivibrio sp.]
MQILNVNNICVSFDKQLVLDNVSFNLEKGQFLTIVGPNGAGKSTLVKTIVRENRNYTGSIAIGTKNKSLGYVAQILPQENYFPATGKEIITSGLCATKIPDKKQRIKTLIELMSVENILDKSFYSMSGGEKRRILIARALCVNDELLVLDEPTTGLDLENTELLYENLRSLKENLSTTVIAVSHDLPRILNQADHVLCLEHKCRFFGSSSEFMNTPICRQLMEHQV